MVLSNVSWGFSTVLIWALTDVKEMHIAYNVWKDKQSAAVVIGPLLGLSQRLMMWRQMFLRRKGGWNLRVVKLYFQWIPKNMREFQSY